MHKSEIDTRITQNRTDTQREEDWAEFTILPSSRSYRIAEAAGRRTAAEDTAEGNLPGEGIPEEGNHLGGTLAAGNPAEDKHPWDNLPADNLFQKLKNQSDPLPKRRFNRRTKLIKAYLEEAARRREAVPDCNSWWMNAGMGSERRNGISDDSGL